MGCSHSSHVSGQSATSTDSSKNDDQTKTTKNTQEAKKNSTVDNKEINQSPIEENKNKGNKIQHSAVEAITSSNTGVEQAATVENGDMVDKIVSEALNRTGSLIHFLQKLDVLEGARTKLEKLNTDGNAKIQALNKIKGHILFETMMHLREVKKKADHFVSYAEQFPYPSTIHMYDDRKKEIECLTQDFDKLPQEQSVVDRKNVINEQIAIALKLLEEKAKYNDQLKESLGITTSNKSESVLAFNYLNMLYRVGKLFITKNETIKNILNTKCENCQDLYSSEIKELIEKFEEITRLQENVEGMKLDSNLVPIINSIVASALESLEDAGPKAENNSTIAKTTEVNKHKKPTQPQKLVDNFKEKLQQLEMAVKELKDKISKIQHPTQNDNFDEHVNEIFKIKERIEDVPSEYEELEPLRKTILQDISNMLSNFDKDVAQLVENQKPSELQLQLQDRFKDANPDKNVVRDVKFITAIHEKAKNFEKYVENYFGTRDLTDYYVIEEHLTRLLEDLDEVNCKNDDQLRTETLNTMDYIKSLLNKLEQRTENNCS